MEVAIVNAFFDIVLYYCIGLAVVGGSVYLIAKALKRIIGTTEKWDKAAYGPWD